MFIETLITFSLRSTMKFFFQIFFFMGLSVFTLSEHCIAQEEDSTNQTAESVSDNETKSGNKIGSLEENNSKESTQPTEGSPADDEYSSPSKKKKKHNNKGYFEFSLLFGSYDKEELVVGINKGEKKETRFGLSGGYSIDKDSFLVFEYQLTSQDYEGIPTNDKLSWTFGSGYKKYLFDLNDLAFFMQASISIGTFKEFMAPNNDFTMNFIGLSSHFGSRYWLNNDETWFCDIFLNLYNHNFYQEVIQQNSNETLVDGQMVIVSSKTKKSGYSLVGSTLTQPLTEANLSLGFSF